MLRVSHETINDIRNADPISSILESGKKICLYFGEASSKLRERGLLNIVLWDGDIAFGLSLTELESIITTVKFQEIMPKPNKSEIVGITMHGRIIRLQHWEGFRTEIDVDTMKTVGQQYTK